MRIFIFISLVTLLFQTETFAAHTADHNHTDVAKQHIQKATGSIEEADHTIVAQINGLVCDFCARALEKVFGKRPEVSGIDVNLDTKIVTIGLKKGKDIDDATITKLITDAGYNVVKINR